MSPSVCSSLCLCLYVSLSRPMGRPKLPPGEDKRSRRNAYKRAWDTAKREKKAVNLATRRCNDRKRRVRRVLEVSSSSSSLESCASTSSGGTSASSATLSDRSLRRRARTVVNAIQVLGLEGERRLFQRSEMLGVLGRNGWVPGEEEAGCSEEKEEEEAGGRGRPRLPGTTKIGRAHV